MSSGSGPFATQAAAAGAIALWSGTAVANKLAVAHIDPMTAGVLRSMIAAVLALALALALRLPRPANGRHLMLLLGSGIACFAAWPLLLSLGLGWTSASHAGLIMALLPVLTGLLGAVSNRRLPRLGWWTGAAVAVGGTVLLVVVRSSPGGDGPSSVTGDLTILAGTSVCAAGYVVGGRLSRVLGGWATTFWGLAAALVALIPAFLLLVARTDWAMVGASGWGAIAYLAVMSSIVGYAAWFWALGRGGITRISTWQFLQPVLTVVVATWLLDEVVTLAIVLTGVLVLVGTALAQRYGGPAPAARGSGRG